MSEKKLEELLAGLTWTGVISGEKDISEYISEGMLLCKYHLGAVAEEVLKNGMFAIRVPAPEEGYIPDKIVFLTTAYLIPDDEDKNVALTIVPVTMNGLTGTIHEYYNIIGLKEEDDQDD